MSLYLSVELCALAIPLVFSFDRKVAYYKMWPFILPAILVNALIFTSIDIYFTSSATWGFNPDYHSGIMIAGLPIEELLFFIIIPYCSMFVHYVFIAYLPGVALTGRSAEIISSFVVLLLLISTLAGSSRYYTSFYSSFTAAAIILTWMFDPSLLRRYYITFLIILIPFLAVNGILTGSFCEAEVFWYNRDEISGIKLLSIPVEDVLFGFSMILLNLLFAGLFRKLIKK